MKDRHRPLAIRKLKRTEKLDYLLTENNYKEQFISTRFAFRRSQPWSYGVVVVGRILQIGAPTANKGRTGRAWPLFAFPLLWLICLNTALTVNAALCGALYGPFRGGGQLCLTRYAYFFTHINGS